MTESNYTRGPWRVSGGDNPKTELTYVVCDALPYPLADVDGTNREEAEANTLLIAAAPDMAELLNDIRTGLHLSGVAASNHKLMERIDALLKKAGVL